ncbi:ABC transporter ATP-binding protein [Microvirga guangxiensis]|uniref:NitT/TauT family transport system ATP-binding protein n=1 Tax=Microvirga guangxiensis TaxID=549386 RepID=A0A1G5KNL5_9HYPH|nr:ABC transporter ATP-binding protein [Microvirga guangxiensis]SCZ02206.1 NitT/TauT family transport system ATP-binding protein [Microvirga guangxiensis]
MTASTLVSLDHVSKVFANGVAALGHFDLHVREGDFISLLGPSGCGKSTVLRLIAGLTEPTSGSVSWPGCNEADHRSEIGFVFQEPTLMPWADVADNVWLPLRLRGVSRWEARERIAESLALVGLKDFAKAYPRELSGGMKMRVSIARALSVKPRLLLMDEPFAALDEITRFKLNDDLLTLQSELNCTVVFVTHSVYESAYLSNRIAVLTPRPGRVIAEIAGVPVQERGSDFRTSMPYAELCRQVSQILTRNLADGGMA